MSADLKLSWTFMINFPALTSTKTPKGQFLQKQFGNQ